MEVEWTRKGRDNTNISFIEFIYKFRNLVQIMFIKRAVE